ncbi:hypothetical protein RBIBE_33660 [Bacillus velezensis]|nr:hypothetical protein RBIBE_33660 [Bacillus velezensis]
MENTWKLPKQMESSRGLLETSARPLSNCTSKKLKRDGMTVKLPETPIFRNMNHTLKMKAAGR